MQKRTNADAEASATVQILTQVVTARKLVEQVQEASGEGDDDDDDDDDDADEEEEEEEEEVPKGPGDGKIMRPPPRLIAASAGQVLRVCLVSLLRLY